MPGPVSAELHVVEADTLCYLSAKQEGLRILSLSAELGQSLTEGLGGEKNRNVPGTTRDDLVSDRPLDPVPETNVTPGNKGEPSCEHADADKRDDDDGIHERSHALARGVE
jgi:hypothetical protein